MHSAVKDLYFATFFLNITNQLYECSMLTKKLSLRFVSQAFVQLQVINVAINLADDLCYIFRFHKNEIIEPLWL